MFGQGEMVYNKNILVYKGRIIMYQKGIKRLLAVVLSACGLLVLSPLLLLLCLAIKLDSPGPIFFRQKRVGIHKNYFNILKFRTMRIDTPHDMPTHLLHDPEQYITRVGRFIRRTSIDELPQFFDVVRGSMSLVGTRPPTLDEYRQYESHHKRRLSMKPGITGLWQVSGRSDIDDFEEVVKLDVQYIDNWSIWMDIYLLFRTVGVVFDRKGAK